MFTFTVALEYFALVNSQLADSSLATGITDSPAGPFNRLSRAFWGGDFPLLIARFGKSSDIYAG